MSTTMMKRAHPGVLAFALAAVMAVLVALILPVGYAQADEGEGSGLNLAGEWNGSYDIGDGSQVWCADYGKAEPMANGGTNYSDPEKLEGVSDEDLRVLVYALQEGKRAIDGGDDHLAAAVSAVVHSAGVNEGVPFDESNVAPEIKEDYDRIINNAPPVPEGTYLTIRTPDNWTPGGRDGHQRVLDYDQIQVGVIEVAKVDAETGDSLEGAEFKVADESGNNIVDSRFSKSEGFYRVQVDPGTYYVTEGKAPDGYLLNGDGGKDANTQEVVVEPNDVMRVTFANRPYPVIEVNKVDENGAPLAGAKIRVSESEGQEIASFVSDTRPVHIKVEPGSYKVEELEAPEGYVKEPEVISFDVAEGDAPIVTLVNVKEVVEPMATPEVVEKEPPTPEIRTQARIEGDTVLKDGTKVVDTVYYSGLIAGEEYEMRHTMMCQDGKAASTSGAVKFTPDNSTGQVDVPITITDASCPIQVVFEELVDSEGKVVAEHKDIDDAAQTVGQEPPAPKKPRVIIKEIPSGPVTAKN